MMQRSTSDSFPRQHARTRRFSLGVPRDLTIDDARQRILFLRSDSGADPVHHLWLADLATGDATKIVDARALGDGDDLPDQERARRERLRESAGGITSYSVDDRIEQIVFGLAGHLYLVALGDDGSPDVQRVVTKGSIYDPRLSPDGTMIGLVNGREFVVLDTTGHERLRLGAPDQPTVSWGTADFVAAEEMRRLRGFWWAPDSTAVAVCRNDESPVNRWFIGDPANPAAAPTEHRYPAAGTPNPIVELYVAPLDGEPVPVQWDRSEFDYLPRVGWTEHGLSITVQTRDQRRIELLDVDPTTGTTTRRWHDDDPHWVELVPGSPAIIGDDDTIMAADRGGTRRLLHNDVAITPDTMQVRSIIAANADRVVFAANSIDDPAARHIHRYEPGTRKLTTLIDGDVVADAAVGTTSVALRTATASEPDVRWQLPSSATLASVAEVPLVEPKLTLLRSGDDRVPTGVCLPSDYDGRALPVLLDPYGGPHAQRVVHSSLAWSSSQWFADQGFAVIVADGRGTPGRGSSVERAVAGDLATGVLDDQLTALDAVAERLPLDLDRVAIRGWSFGGYLAALAVMRHPERIHAAIAGAPVTEWRLYDTHYTERYLGDPNEQPDAYDACSLVAGAADLTRPLLLIHGLADDNVVAAHTLLLSAALLAAGRDHEVLPLAGVTHMTPQETIAEHLMLHQLRFLRRVLGLTTVGRNE